MIKEKLLILMLLCCCFTSFSQNKQTGFVTYECTLHIGSKINNFQASLYFNPDSNYFQALNKTKTSDSVSLLMRDKTLEAKTLIGIPDTTGFKIITDKKNKTIFSKEPLMNKLVSVYEAIPDFGWAISSETKRIGNQNCQKATSTFRGRNYTAWFSTKISVDAGPYKFQGLPGLIMEIVDDKNQVHFIAQKIVFPYNKSIPINPSYSRPMGRAAYVAEAKKSLGKLTQYLESSRADRATGKITVKAKFIGIEDIDAPL